MKAPGRAPRPAPHPVRPAALAALAALALQGCAPALRGPPPAPGPGPPGPEASLEEVQAQLGRLERERDPGARAALLAAAVEEGRRCRAAWPGSPACAYALALGLGVQARERPSTGLDALPTMLELLRAAEVGDAALDRAGPARVQALIYLRAPGWPLGPGDAEAGLEAARRAARLAPEHAPNRLALAEALAATGAVAEARRAAAEAAALARAAAARGEPGAPGWLREAERLGAGP